MTLADKKIVLTGKIGAVAEHIKNGSSLMQVKRFLTRLDETLGEGESARFLELNADMLLADSQGQQGILYMTREQQGCFESMAQEMGKRAFLKSAAFGVSVFALLAGGINIGVRGKTMGETERGISSCAVAGGLTGITVLAFQAASEALMRGREKLLQHLDSLGERENEVAAFAARAATILEPLLENAAAEVRYPHEHNTTVRIT